MKKVIAGVAVLAVMAGCLFAGNVENSKSTTPEVADRWGVIIV